MPVNGHPFHLPAESEGFEPPVQRNVYTAFRVRLFRPLRQLSSFRAAKVQQKMHIRKKKDKKLHKKSIFFCKFRSIFLQIRIFCCTFARYLEY